jgi:protein-S-isoprenylcysteine O-methyltransferase Ste14
VTVGKGTLAHWNPTQRLVVQGIYRHIRNPMIAGVCCLLVGESLVAASLPLFAWFVVFVIANAVYFPVAEERGMVNRFGDNDLAYQRNVPRWIPRLRPWDGEEYAPHDEKNRKNCLTSRDLPIYWSIGGQR